MFNIPEINLNVVKKDGRIGIFEITPLVEGFGHTVGSALRRTLLSSTKGAAITKVSIEGIFHEFSTINGVKDDVLQILLNLKKVRFAKVIDEDIELALNAVGPKEVKASDIEITSGVEVKNPDFIITSLDSKKDTLKAKLTLESGYGYRPVDKSANVPIGSMLLDANFSPIVNVVTVVEPTRVGRDTNYDKLTITVETDGTVDAEDAIRSASKTLKEFFYKVQTGKEYVPEEDEAMLHSGDIEGGMQTRLPADEVVLEELHLPTRTINALRKAGIKTLGDLADRGEDELLRVRNLGEKSIREILSLLEKEGLK